jgi:hypothetical protein
MTTCGARTVRARAGAARLAIAGLVSLLGLGSRTASAEEAASSSTPHGAPSFDVTIDGGLSLGASDYGVGVGIDAKVLLRYRWLQLGGRSEAIVGPASSLGAGGLLGVALPLGARLRVELLAEGGAHEYSVHGDPGDPGVKGTVPYAGGRLRLSRAFSPNGRATFVVAVELFGAADLARHTFKYAYDPPNPYGWACLFPKPDDPSCPPTPPQPKVPVTHTIGTNTTGAAFTVGVRF